MQAYFLKFFYVEAYIDQSEKYAGYYLILFLAYEITKSYATLTEVLLSSYFCRSDFFPCDSKSSLKILKIPHTSWRWRLLKEFRVQHESCSLTYLANNHMMISMRERKMYYVKEEIPYNNQPTMSIFLPKPLVNF